LPRPPSAALSRTSAPGKAHTEAASRADRGADGVFCAQVWGTCERSSLFTGAILKLRPAPEVRSMHETHERASTTSLRLPRSWRSRVVVVAAIVICYGAFLYGIAHMRAPRSSNANGPPMFAPVVSKVRVPRKVTISSKPWKPSARDQLTPPPRHWKFPPIDLWPSAPGWSATWSEFTPVYGRTT
jgi:hypothetical protein